MSSSEREIQSHSLQPQHWFKVALVGESQTGKSSLFRRFSSYNFEAKTHGIQTDTNLVTLIDKLQLCDTSSDANLQQITLATCLDSHAVIYIYDVTRRNTFLRAGNSDCFKQAIERGIPCFLMANKSDQDPLDWRVCSIEAEEFSRAFGCLAYYEVSAKTSMNVNDSFLDCVSLLVQPSINSRATNPAKILSPLEAKGARYDHIFKLILLGDEKSGKSSLATQFHLGTFTDKFTATIGVEFFPKNLQIDGTVVKLQVWDLSGSSRFNNILQNYISSGEIFFFVYDVTEKDALASLARNWLTKPRPDKAPGFLLANKCDRLEHRSVSRGEGEEFAAANGLVYHEVTARSGQSVNQVFLEGCQMMVNRAIDESYEAVSEQGLLQVDYSDEVQSSWCSVS